MKINIGEFIKIPVMNKILHTIELCEEFENSIVSISGAFGFHQEDETHSEKCLLNGVGKERLKFSVFIEGDGLSAHKVCVIYIPKIAQEYTLTFKSIFEERNREWIPCKVADEKERAGGLK